MGVGQRLDEIDRRLGLQRSVDRDRRVARWWRVFVVATSVLLAIAATLYLTGHTAAANAVMCLPGICALQALDGWSAARRLRRDAERSAASGPPEQ